MYIKIVSFNVEMVWCWYTGCWVLNWIWFLILNILMAIWCSWFFSLADEISGKFLKWHCVWELWMLKLAWDKGCLFSRNMIYNDHIFNIGFRFLTTLLFSMLVPPIFSVKFLFRRLKICFSPFLILSKLQSLLRIFLKFRKVWLYVMTKRIWVDSLSFLSVVFYGWSGWIDHLLMFVGSRVSERLPLAPQDVSSLY